MFKNIFSAFLNSFSESQKLEKRYQQLVTRIGWITVAISCLALIGVMYISRLMFGLPVEGGSLEGLRLNLISWVIFLIIVIPIIFYVGMVLVYGAFGIVMFLLGKISWSQVIDCACYGKYPNKWYKTYT